MTWIVSESILIAEHPSLSPYVLSALTLPGATARQTGVPLADGGVAFTGPSVGEAGTLSFECHILGTSRTNLVTVADALEATFGWADTDREVVVFEDEVIGKVYRGRPASYAPVVDGTDTALARIVIALTDPRWFADNTKTVSVGVASMSGGITTPINTTGGITTTGSGSTGDVTVVNSGTAKAPWTAYITGPVDTPRLILGGQTLELRGVVPAGSTLVVDSYNGTIRLDGATRPWATFESTWWEIPPGTSTFSFRAISGTGTAMLIWRDASK